MRLNIYMLCMATFFSAAMTPAKADNMAPALKITSPKDGEQYKNGDEIGRSGPATLDLP